MRGGQRLGREGLAEPHGPSQRQRGATTGVEQGGELMRTAFRKTFLGAAVEWEWRAARCERCWGPDLAANGAGEVGISPAWSCSPYHVFQLPTSEQG